ncbi:MAG: GTP-binding protein [Clostridiales bacterium]|nr:GTP-binding protein [Clostridiales bacterium]
MNSLLKFITCGSVDDGKSTLLGHILYDAKLLYADQEKALILDSKVGSRGGEIDYSLLLDGLTAEREQGITIDVAYLYFTTERRSFIAADTPGHEEYTRNMAGGASFAKLAVVMVDAEHGVLSQTRRHARICTLMGIRYFVFAVNKMDLVNYSEERFREIRSDIDALSGELGLQHVKVIPVSATQGDNITHALDHMPWYQGGTLLDYLETVDVTEDENQDTFYLPVQRVCRPDHTFRGFQGQVESGRVVKGQKLTVLSGGESAHVKAIHIGFEEVPEAYAGQAVTIQLDREVDVSRGCVLADTDRLPVAKRINATLLWMDDEPLYAGKEYLIRIGTKKISGVVTAIQYKIDVNTGEHLPTEKLEKNEIALCRLELAENIVVDAFDTNKTLGELILIDRVSHATSACGVVENVGEETEKPYFEKGEIRTDGYIFEEFYFNIDNALLSRANEGGKTYHVGDEVPVKGDSYHYPESFDIIAVKSEAAILIRDRRVKDILPLSEYRYSGLPTLDARGFEIQIRGEADYQDYLYERRNMDDGNHVKFYDKWFRFETYRRIMCTDNFWMI